MTAFTFWKKSKVAFDLNEVDMTVPYYFLIFRVVSGNIHDTKVAIIVFVNCLAPQYHGNSKYKCFFIVFNDFLRSSSHTICTAKDLSGSPK